MNINEYQHFTTEMFLEDEYFRQWVLQPKEETTLFWEQFLYEYPEKKAEVLAAKDLLRAIHHHYDKEVQTISKDKATTSYIQLERQMKPTAKNRKLSRKSWLGWAAAASIALMIGLTTFFYVQPTDSRLTFTTGNGQRLPIDLPDGSNIQLNANSSLYYYPNQWKEQDTRKVWLDGEAFFKVQRKVGDVKFKVHAGGMEIAVLGTQFNVRARGEKAEVVLEEGKVELAIEEQKITMTPGDLVSYSTNSHEINSKKVKTEEYVAWKDGITIFNDSLKEVVKELEILYGIRFSIQNKALENRIIQLSAPTNSLEQVLETLELLYPEEIHIEQQDDQIIIL